MSGQGRRRHALAALVSAGLHAAAGLALLAPQPEPATLTAPPLVVEVVPSPAPPAPAPMPAPVQALAAKSKPAARPATRPAAAPVPTPPRFPASVPAETTSFLDDPTAMATTAATATAASDDGGKAEATAPGYILGEALTPLPDYPWSARRRGIEGRVVVRLAVDADGRPTAVDLVHSSGDPSLDKAALAALWRWRLRPATAHGRPTAGAVVVPILFKLT